MVIKCRLSPEKHIEIDGYVICQSLGTRGPVVFIVDTGSEVTSIGHKDAMAMGIRASGLRPSPERVAGIGGFAQSYELPDVDIIIRNDEEVIFRLEKVFYHKPIVKKKTKTKGPMRYERESVAAAPSILGMDAIAKMNVILETDAETFATLRSR